MNPHQTVLLVEDDDMTRDTTAQMLQALGCRVIEASDVTGALAALRKHAVTLLMADIGLPGESGLLFAARARQLRPTLPIIFATGGDVRDDAPDGHGPLVLRKPYGMQALEQALSDVVLR